MQKGDKMGRIFKIVLIAYCFLAVQALLAGCSNGNPVKDVKKTYLPQNKETPETNKTGNTEGMEGFKGVEWTKEDEEKYAIYHGSLDICTDRDNGGAYYIKWGYDNYLYYWKDGKRKLVLDKWVSQICYMDGIIYCIYDKTGKSYKEDVYPSYEGVICSVNVKTGEFKKLSGTKAKYISVCREGIYYRWCTGPEAEKQKDEFGFYSFNDKKVYKSFSQQENGTVQERYGKYAVVYRDGAFCLKNLEDGKEQLFIPASENPLYTRICNGQCYYTSLGKEKIMSRINLKDGKKQKLSDVFNVNNITQLNNSNYFYLNTGTSGQLYVYDPVKDKGAETDIKDTYSNPHSGYMVEGLCSDGEYLYAVVCNHVIYSKTGITGFVVLKADGGEVSEVWSSLEYYNSKNKNKK